MQRYVPSTSQNVNFIITCKGQLRDMEGPSIAHHKIEEVLIMSSCSEGEI